MPELSLSIGVGTKASPLPARPSPNELSTPPSTWNNPCVPLKAALIPALPQIIIPPQSPLCGLGEAEVKISDLTGRVVLQQTLNSSMLDVRSLSDGMYLLHLYMNDQFYSMVKITILK